MKCLPVYLEFGRDLRRCFIQFYGSPVIIIDDDLDDLDDVTEGIEYFRTIIKNELPFDPIFKLDRTIAMSRRKTISIAQSGDLKTLEYLMFSATTGETFILGSKGNGCEIGGYIENTAARQGRFVGCYLSTSQLVELENLCGLYIILTDREGVGLVVGEETRVKEFAMSIPAESVVGGNDGIDLMDIDQASGLFAVDP